MKEIINKLVNIVAGLADNQEKVVKTQKETNVSIKLLLERVESLESKLKECCKLDKS